MREIKHKSHILVIFILCLCLVLSFATISSAAGICEECTQNSDCDSNNCGVATSDSSIRKCIPTGATEYTCSAGSDDGGGGCFIDAIISE